MTLPGEDLLRRCAAGPALIAALGDEAWERTGLRPEEGPLSVRELVTRGANQAEEHAAQIRELRA